MTTALQAVPRVMRQSSGSTNVMLIPAEDVRLRCICQSLEMAYALLRDWGAAHQLVSRCNNLSELCYRALDFENHSACSARALIKMQRNAHSTSSSLRKGRNMIQVCREGG